MSSQEFVVVSLVVAAFAAFGVTLAATIWYANRAEEAR